MATASLSRPASPGAPPQRRLSRRRSRQLLGLMYVAPTVVFVAVFFIAPLLLVIRMSASQWPLLGGDKGLNLPTNYQVMADSSLFWPAVGFTLEYTVLATVLLLGMGLGLALLICGSVNAQVNLLKNGDFEYAFDDSTAPAAPPPTGDQPG